MRSGENASRQEFTVARMHSGENSQQPECTDNSIKPDQCEEREALN